MSRISRTLSVLREMIFKIGLQFRQAHPVPVAAFPLRIPNHDPPLNKQRLMSSPCLNPNNELVPIRGQKKEPFER